MANGSARSQDGMRGIGLHESLRKIGLDNASIPEVQTYSRVPGVNRTASTWTSPRASKLMGRLL